MERTAAGRQAGGAGVTAVPAEVDLSRVSVERARRALGLLRAAVAVPRVGGTEVSAGPPPFASARGGVRQAGGG
jgi:hypothetical protein